MTDTSKPVLKFMDAGETIGAMMDEILVTCPRCQSCARITPLASEEQSPRLKRSFALRLVCPHCSLVKQWEENSWGYDPNADPVCDWFFGLPLWLQAPCCGQILWANNERHLRFLEEYVQADLREHRRDPQVGWRNSSLASSLPEWMIIAKHREAVLHTVARLKQKLTDAT